MFKEKRLVSHMIGKAPDGVDRGAVVGRLLAVVPVAGLLYGIGFLAGQELGCGFSEPIGQARARVSEVMSGQCQASNPKFDGMFFVPAQDEVCEK